MIFRAKWRWWWVPQPPVWICSSSALRTNSCKRWRTTRPCWGPTPWMTTAGYTYVASARISMFSLFVCTNWAFAIFGLISMDFHPHHTPICSASWCELWLACVHLFHHQRHILEFSLTIGHDAAAASPLSPNLLMRMMLIVMRRFLAFDDGIDVLAGDWPKWGSDWGVQRPLQGGEVWNTRWCLREKNR